MNEIFETTLIVRENENLLIRLMRIEAGWQISIGESSIRTGKKGEKSEFHIQSLQDIYLLQDISLPTDTPKILENWWECLEKDSDFDITRRLSDFCEWVLVINQRRPDNLCQPI